MGEKKTSDKLLLIDANSLIYRAYHALPPLTDPGGRPAGALYGLASILIKLFKEGAPRYVVAAFDRPEPTFRKKVFKEYKATRPPTPDDLIPQLAEAREMMKVFGVRALDAPGFEADDIIAVLADRFAGDVEQVVIISGDLDTLQSVVGDKVVAEIPKRGVSETITYNRDKVIERLGVPPEMVADYKGLVGDKSDNIPGVLGVGPKTAASLISRYGTIEEIYEKLGEIEKESETLATKLKKNEKSARLSKKLATFAEDVPTPDKLEELSATCALDNEVLHKYLEGLGFQTLLKRIQKEPEEERDRIGKLF